MGATPENTNETYDGDHVYTGLEFSCSDAPAAPIEQILKGAAAAEWLDMAPTGDCPALKLLCRKISLEEFRTGFTADSPIQFSKAAMDLATWPLIDYEVLWRSSAGGSSALISSPKRIFLQTPDDGGPFCSFAVMGKGIYGKAVYLYSDDCFAPSKVLQDALIYSGWRRGANQIVCMPVSFLKVHVSETTRELAALGKSITFVENVVSEPRGMYDTSVDYAFITRKLHACSGTLVRLERRHRFEEALVSTIERFLSTVESGEKINGFSQMNGSRMSLQKSMMTAAAHEFVSLPKRIDNQRTMIFNLILQRDQQLNLSISRANMEIADNARRIAEATMADSAAMKTIAIMTMLFLPGTAVASFFSMGMFNWQPGAGEHLASNYIWVYFVAAVPLTLAVVGTWALAHQKLMKKIKRSSTLRSTDFIVEELARTKTTIGDGGPDEQTATHYDEAGKESLGV